MLPFVSLPKLPAILLAFVDFGLYLPSLTLVSPSLYLQSGYCIQAEIVVLKGLTSFIQVLQSFAVCCSVSEKQLLPNLFCLVLLPFLW